MIPCDNHSRCHSPIITGEDNCAVRTTCTTCHQSVRIGKDKNGEPEHRLYGEWFKKDVLQPGPPLFYKYNSSRMNVI